MPQLRTRPTRGTDERGVTLVMVALSLVALLIVSALIIDGGVGYTQYRNMKNSSDGGAIAGAQALERFVFNLPICGASAALCDPYTQALAEVTAHGGVAPTNGDPLCWIVDSSGNPINGTPSASDCLTPANKSATNAAGVRVESEHNANTFFGTVAGQSTQTVRGRSTATIQLFAAAAPYVVCGAGASDNNGPGWDLLDPGPPQTVNQTRGLLLYGIVDEVGPQLNYPGNPPLVIHQNSPTEPKVQCGGGSSFDGRGNGGFAAGNNVVLQNGNGNNPNPNNTIPPTGPLPDFAGTKDITVIDCPSDVRATSLATNTPNGCDIVLPIADYAQQLPGSKTYHIVAFGVFRIISGGGNDKVNGWFEGIAPPDPLGFTGTGQCIPSQVALSDCLVKLLT